MIQKDTILKLLTQEQIFERYFPFVIEFNKDYINPYRNDKHPGCEFKYSKAGVLYFIDWARNKRYDCFNAAQEHYKEYNFQRVLQKIDKDFKLNLKPTSLSINERKVNITKETNDYYEYHKKKKDTKYSYKRSGNIEEVLKFYGKYDFKKEDVEFLRIYHLEFFQVNDHIIWSSKDFPIFQYVFDDYNYQIYLPYAKSDRFYTVSEASYLAGFDLLPHFGEDVVITSSYKDVGVVSRKLQIPSVCPLGEFSPIKREDLVRLSKRFNQIWVNYNNDKAGIDATNKLLKTYPEFNIKTIFNQLEKDPSDTYSEYGKEHLIKEFEQNGFNFRKN